MLDLLKNLYELGLSQKQAQEIAHKINDCLKQNSPEQAWQAVVENVLTRAEYKILPFSIHQLIYESIYPDFNSAPGIAWQPSQELIESANVTRLMQAVDCHNYPALHRWSVEYYPDFWEKMIQTLPIVFSKNYSAIVDLKSGLESPQWLPGALLNIATSCFNAKDSEIAIIYQTEESVITKMTYKELDELSTQIAASLQCYLHQGDRVAIIMPMTPEAVAIYLGIIKAGCCVVSIADSFSSEEIATRLTISDTKAVFTQDIILRDSKKLPLYKKIKNAHAPFTIVLPATHSIAEKIDKTDLFWEDFLSTKKTKKTGKNNSPFQAVACEPQAYTNILFSSGTTGEPKAIPWDHITPIKCGSDAYLYQNVQPGNVICWPTNLGWMMGPWLIYAALLNKATLAIYNGTPNKKSFGKFVQDARVTILGLVPSLVRSWRLSGCMEGLDWSSIKVFSSSGECSNSEDMLYLMSLANYKPIIEYCGGTEIGGAYLTSTVIQPSAPSTFTTPTLGLDVVILDEQGLPTKNGEVALIPPSMGLSTELLNKDHHHVYYADMPHSPNGQLLRRHGDQIQQLANGFYRMHGRTDDTMNLGGVKVSSVEIENSLNPLPCVNEVAAIPINPPGGGPSQLVIYAVLNQQESLSVEEIKLAMQNRIKEHLNPLFKIHDVVLVDTLPRTASNKLMRRVLKDQYQKVNSY